VGVRGCVRVRAGAVMEAPVVIADRPRYKNICICDKDFKSKRGLASHKRACPQVIAAINAGKMECDECKAKNAIITELRAKVFDLEAKIGAMPVLRPNINALNSPHMAHINLDVVEPIFRIERVLTPTKLIELIWINSEYPENFSMYSLDEKKDEIYAFNGKTWIKDTKLNILAPIRKMVYRLTSEFVAKMKPGGAVNPTLIEQLRVNAADDSLLQTELSHIQKLLIANANILIPPINAVREK